MKNQTGYTITWQDSAERNHESIIYAPNGNPDRALGEFHVLRQLGDKLELDEYKVTDFKQDGFSSFLLPPKNPKWDTLKLPKTILKHYTESKKKETARLRNEGIVSALMAGEKMCEIAAKENMKAPSISSIAKHFGKLTWLSIGEKKLIDAIRASKATDDTELDKFAAIARNWLSAA